MNGLLLRILWQKQGKWQFLVAGIGFGIGLLILLLSLQLFIDVRELLSRQEKEGEGTYLMVNKEVTLMNTFSPGQSGFTEEEIADLQQQDFIEDLGIFTSNDFGIEANLQFQLGMNADIFFESVPNEFLDTVPEDFRWEREKAFVPILVSTDFLNLYNFGFALSQGLPQLPPEAVQMVPFDILLSGAGGKQVKLKARVVGFSDRINSVVVPQDFMQWANEELGSGQVKKPSRLILKVKDPGSEVLENYLKEHKYLTNSERLRTDQAKKILNIVLTLAAGLGLMFLVLSFVIFVINFQLILSRAKEEIDILIDLGYTYSHINSRLTLQFFTMLVVVAGLAYSTTYWVVNRLHVELAQRGLEIGGSLSGWMFVVIGAALFLLLIINSISLKLNIRR